MPMLKTVKQMKISQKNASFYKTGWGVKDIFDYLVGEKLEQKNNVHTIQNYLHSGHHAKYERVRAERLSPNLTQLNDSKYDWAQEMLDTKRAWGKEAGRQYYHFVFSPDPQDKVGVDEVADMAAEWAGNMYPEGQWAVEVHDDNTNHIPHAHIILNSVLPKTGYKVQRSNTKIIQEARAAQKIAEKHGLSTLEDIVEWRKEQRKQEQEELLQSQPEKLSMAERALKKEGKWSWKQDIRDAVNETVGKSSNMEQFIYLMEAKGYKVNRSGRCRDITFSHPRSQGYNYRASSKSLGANYTTYALKKRLRVDFVGAAMPADANEVKLKELQWQSDKNLLNREISYHRRKYVALVRKDAIPIYQKKVRYILAKKHSQLREIQNLANCINLLAQDKISSESGVQERYGVLQQELAAAKVTLEKAQAATARAQEIKTTLSTYRTDEKRMDELEQAHVLNVAARLERAQLKPKLNKERAWLDKQFASAHDFLAINTSLYVSDEKKSELLCEANRRILRLAQEGYDTKADTFAKYSMVLDALSKNKPYTEHVDIARKEHVLKKNSATFTVGNKTFTQESFKKERALITAKIHKQVLIEKELKKQQKSEDLARLEQNQAKHSKKSLGKQQLSSLAQEITQAKKAYEQAQEQTYEKKNTLKRKD